VGITGCGWVAEHGHLPALTRMPEVEVVAVADVDRVRCNRIADSFDVTRRYSDHLALVQDPSVDAVGVCAPAHAHVELAMASADAGKPVLLEKPPALSLDEWDRLAARVEGAGITFMLGLNMRWHSAFRAARELIRAGTFGQIQCVSTTLANDTLDRRAASDWRGERRRGGGALVEMGVHHFDLWQFLLDADIEEVSTITRGDDESLAVAGRMRSGVPVSALFSHRTADVNEVDIYGDAGSLRVSPYSAPRVLGIASMPWTIRAKLADLGSTMSLAHAIRRRRDGGFYVGSFVAEWRHFAQAVTRGTAVETGLGSGRRLLQVILAAAASATEGRAVRCDDAPPTLASPTVPSDSAA
jgi:predicted dehydrogenase